MLLYDRSDGERVRDLRAFNAILPYVVRKRNEAAVLMSKDIEVESAMAYIRRKNGELEAGHGQDPGAERYSLFGLLIAHNLDPIVRAIEWLFSFKAFPQDVYLLDKLPSRVLLPDVVAITITAFIISFLATIIPSRQAARVDPVVAIRYE